MKKINVKSCIIILTICVLFLALNAYAQDKTTTAQVEFTEGNGPTYPVDPDDPDTDIEIEPPVEGALAIVDVSNFYFGYIPLTSRGRFHDIETGKPNIQVVDLRGTATGWSVIAEVSSFTSGGVESLPSTFIHIHEGRPKSLSNSPAPIQKPVALPADGTPKPVIAAHDGAGTGLWVMRWYPEDTGDEGNEEAVAYIQLEVPEGVATKGTHTATITWTLENTPS